LIIFYYFLNRARNIHSQNLFLAQRQAVACPALQLLLSTQASLPREVFSLHRLGAALSSAVPLLGVEELGMQALALPVFLLVVSAVKLMPPFVMTTVVVPADLVL